MRPAPRRASRWSMSRGSLERLDEGSGNLPRRIDIWIGWAFDGDHHHRSIDLDDDPLELAVGEADLPAAGGDQRSGFAAARRLQLSADAADATGIECLLGND